MDQPLSSSLSFLRNLWGGSDLREGVHLLVSASAFLESLDFLTYHTWKVYPVWPGKVCGKVSCPERLV